MDEYEETLDIDAKVLEQNAKLAANDIVVRLYQLANENLLFAQDIADTEGEGTDDQLTAESEAKTMLEACAEIHRLRQSDGGVILTILANTPPDEWLSKAAIHDALKQWRSPATHETREG